MLAQQRQTAILDLIRQRGGVRVSHLVSRFGVSDMTIRRDLEVLAERGLVDKVHGGATLAGPGSAEEPASPRSRSASRRRSGPSRNGRRPWSSRGWPSRCPPARPPPRWPPCSPTYEG
ncbi:hypothetical protein GCM10027614_70380 [Micromonospora vulcania]